MAKPTETDLLAALLESWERHNTIMLNLLESLPEGGLEAEATDTSPTVAQMFSHIHHERLVSVSEEAPEYAKPVPENEWATESSKEHLADMLHESAEVVKQAVAGRVLAGKSTDLNFGHPALMLQFLLWHEGYHHGQMKLALKISGLPVPDDQAGPLTWDVWRKKFVAEPDAL